MSATVIFCGSSALLAGVIALSAILRSKPSLARLLFCAGMAAVAVEGLFGAAGLGASTLEKALFWQRTAFLAACFAPGSWVLFSLTYSRETPAWLNHKALSLVLCGSATALLAALVLRTPVISEAWTTGGGGTVWHLGRGGRVFHLFQLLGAAWVLLNLERTFRASVGTIRWRIKFMLVGLVLLLGVRVFTSSQAMVYSAVDPHMMEPLRAGALWMACILFAWSLARSAFESIGVHPSSEVLRNPITLVSLGVYLIAVGVLAKVFMLLGNPAGFPIQALLVLVVLVLISMVALSERVRQRTGQWINRQFHRPVYNYRQIWILFAEQTSSILSEPDLCRAVVKLTSQTFHVLSVTIWLIEENKRLVFGASTSLAPNLPQVAPEEPSNLTSLIEGLRASPGPFNLDGGNEQWLQLLRRRNPDFFHGGGGRLCVPLVAHGEVLGLISLGDRVGTQAFCSEDIDLIKCIGDQVSGSLLNLRLSKKVLRAKELEAFQAMSAFFAHDLKNTVHSLSLLLQNLPIHFQDPAFRLDAQRAVANSVTHLNQLVGRLSLLRQKLEVAPRAIDLNALVKSTLAELHLPPPSAMRTDLGVLRPTLADPDQIQTVITNLILNAREAGASAAGIEIATEQRHGWSVLSVRDRGCGMTREFVQESLFRPFQTTKKTGLGIGLFHSKTIVEAHRGEMEVESEPGQGTTVRVFLPSQEN